MKWLHYHHGPCTDTCREQLDAKWPAVANAVSHDDYCCGMMGTYAGDGCPGTYVGAYA